MFQVFYGSHSTLSLVEGFHGRSKHRSSSLGQHFTVLTFSYSPKVTTQCNFLSSAVIKIEIPCEEMPCYYVTKAKIFAFESRNLFYQEKKKPQKPTWFRCSMYSKCIALVRRQRKKPTYYRKYLFFFYYTMLLIAQPHERWNNLDFHKPPQC